MQFTLLFTTIAATSAASSAASNAIYTQVNSSSPTSKKSTFVPHAFWHQHKSVPTEPASVASAAHVFCHQHKSVPSLSSVSYRSQKATAANTPTSSKLRGSNNTDIVDILKQVWMWLTSFVTAHVDTIIIIGALLLSMVCLTFLVYLMKKPVQHFYQAPLDEEDLEQGYAMYQPVAVVSGKPAYAPIASGLLVL